MARTAHVFNAILSAPLLPSWRIVSADDFGATDGPELCLGRVLNTFRLPHDERDELVGTIVLGHLDLEDIAQAARPWTALRRHRRVFRRVFCDQRAMTVDPSHLVELFQRLSGGPLPERATCLVATPWTMHFWHGIARLAPQVRLEAHMDEGSAWSSLDASEAERELISALEKRALRLVAKGLGQTAPIGSNKTASGRAQNRRVVFRVLDRALSPDASTEGAVQKRSRRAQRTDEAHTDVARVAKRGFEGGGDPFPFFERIQEAFGDHDLGSIRAHMDARAMEAARELHAEAYASGEHVAFASAPDLHTAAHEAAHVVQQRAGVSLPDGVGRVGDHYERHADAVADAVVAGRSAQGLLSRIDGGSAGRGVVGRHVQRSEAAQNTPGGAHEALDTVDDVIGALGEAAFAAQSDKRTEAMGGLAAVIGWLEARSSLAHLKERFGVSGLQTTQLTLGNLLGDLKLIQGTLRLGGKPKGHWANVQRQVVLQRALLQRLNDEPTSKADVPAQLEGLDRKLGVVAGCVAIGAAVSGAVLIGAEVVTFVGANYLRAELTRLVILNPEVLASGAVLILDISAVGFVAWASRFQTWEGALQAIQGMLELSMMAQGGTHGTPKPRRVHVKAEVLEQTPHGLKVKVPTRALLAEDVDTAPPPKGSKPDAKSGKPQHEPESPTREPGQKAQRPPDPHSETAEALVASGQTEDSFKAVQAICDEFKVVIRFRPTSKHAKPHIEKGASPKPESVKMKTVNDTDVDLGARPSTRGTVGYGKLRLPKNFHRIEKSDPAKAARIRARLRERRAERKALGKDVRELEKKGDFKFRKRQMVDQRPGEPGRGKPVAGDNDLFDIRNADGTPLTDKEHYDKVMNALKRSAAKVQHPDVMSWNTKKAKDAKMKAGLIKRHQKGGEKLIEFRPGGSATQSFAEDSLK